MAQDTIRSWFHFSPAEPGLPRPLGQSLVFKRRGKIQSLFRQVHLHQEPRSFRSSLTLRQGTRPGQLRSQLSIPVPGAPGLLMGLSQNRATLSPP